MTDHATSSVTSLPQAVLDVADIGPPPALARQTAVGYCDSPRPPPLADTHVVHIVETGSPSATTIATARTASTPSRSGEESIPPPPPLTRQTGYFTKVRGDRGDLVDAYVDTSASTAAAAAASSAAGATPARGPRMCINARLARRLLTFMRHTVRGAAREEMATRDREFHSRFTRALSTYLRFESSALATNQA